MRMIAKLNLWRDGWALDSAIHGRKRQVYIQIIIFVQYSFLESLLNNRISYCKFNENLDFVFCF